MIMYDTFGLIFLSNYTTTKINELIINRNDALYKNIVG